MANCKDCIKQDVCDRDVGHGYYVCPCYLSADEVVLKQDNFAELPVDKLTLELTPGEKAFVNAWKGQASECDIATLLRMFGAKMDGGQTE